jgi:hypothetical protein
MQNLSVFRRVRFSGSSCAGTGRGAAGVVDGVEAVGGR